MLSDMVVNPVYGLQEIKNEVCESVAFDTDKDSITVDLASDHKQVTYDAIRHVSLTVLGTGIQGTPGDKIVIYVQVGNAPSLGTLATINDNDVHTYQFDSKSFAIYVFDADGFSSADWALTTLAEMP
jgi:hypothetical protein